MLLTLQICCCLQLFDCIDCVHTQYSCGLPVAGGGSYSRLPVAGGGSYSRLPVAGRRSYSGL